MVTVTVGGAKCGCWLELVLTCIIAIGLVSMFVGQVLVEIVGVIVVDVDPFHGIIF